MRNTYVAATPGFIADHQSIVLRGTGVQIDWATVNASFVDANTGKKRLQAGTPVGEVTAGGKVAERVVTTRPAIGLLATDAVEGARIGANDSYGLIIGGAVYENLLPVALDAATITELQDAGTGFAFQDYADDRAS